MGGHSKEVNRSCQPVDETGKSQLNKNNINKNEVIHCVDMLREQPQSQTLMNANKHRQVESKMVGDASSNGCRVGHKRSLDGDEVQKLRDYPTGKESRREASPWDPWKRRVRRKLRSRARIIPAKVCVCASQLPSGYPFSPGLVKSKMSTCPSCCSLWTVTATNNAGLIDGSRRRINEECSMVEMKSQKVLDCVRNSLDIVEGRICSQNLEKNMGVIRSDCINVLHTDRIRNSGGQPSNSLSEILPRLSKVDEFKDTLSEPLDCFTIKNHEDGFHCSSSLIGYGALDHNLLPSKLNSQGAPEGSYSLVLNQLSPKHEQRVNLKGLSTRGDFTDSHCVNSCFSSGKADEMGLSDIFTRPSLFEGRKCGLCGGGSDREPAKGMGNMGLGLKDADDAKEREGHVADSHVAQTMGSVSGIGWLGKLLGPLSDRIGVAGVWVHQQCAIWSPEVYFLGIGRLKNVQAAIRRGRYLKCSRCCQPGATIGCRVDRCPRTYHLPCARIEGCSFNHEKYLMACVDHLHMFRGTRNLKPRSVFHTSQTLKSHLKHENHDSGCCKVPSNAPNNFPFLHKGGKDEENVVENVGEDEEFLKRERKRLQRDLARLAPVMLGNSVESASNAEGWESVAGLQEVVECLKEMVILPLLYPSSYTSLGILPPKGVLLHGHPGTGKTHVVQALVGACSRGKQKIAYFSRKGADCLGKYVGDSERQLRLLFQMAEQYQPSIIFFDEIDGLAPKRSRHQDQTHCSVVSTLLALMDGLKSRGSVVVIGATNRPDALDPALRRPGRFDRELYFPLPSIEDRAAIIALHTKKWSFKPSNTVIQEVANLTSGFAGADLQALCTQAVVSAFKRVCPLKELLDSLGKQTKISELQTFPNFEVCATDWASALGNISLPCSRRIANIGFSEVSVAPLPRHTVPVLLRPLLQILFSLDFDGRFTLPPALARTLCLAKAALRGKSTKLGKFSELNLWSHIRYCCSKKSLVGPLEQALIQGGLIANAQEFRATAENTSTANNDYGACDTTQGPSPPDNIMNSVSGQIQQCNPDRPKWKSSSFRVLICGRFGRGQNLLASSVLHGFQGAAQLRLLSLHTIIQAGCGDAEQGIINIVGECRNVAPCVMLMTYLDSWAVEQSPCNEQEPKYTKSNSVVMHKRKFCGIEPCHGASKPSSEGASEGSMAVTTLWNIFLQQLQMLPKLVPLMIVATSAVSRRKLPYEILFFFGHSEDSRAVRWGIVPSFLLDLKTYKHYSKVFDLASQNLSNKLAKYFVHSLRLHGKEGNGSLQAKERSPKKAVNTESLDKSLKDANDHESLVGTLHLEEESAEKKSSLLQALPFDVNHTVMEYSSRALETVTNCEKDQATDIQGELQGCASYKVMRKCNCSPLISCAEQEALCNAIKICGSQLLQYPKFSALRLATKKLKSGPSISLAELCMSRPGRNTCGRCASSAKHVEVLSADCGSDSREECKARDRRYWGLNAVGFKACGGLYATASDVAVEVQSVVELLRDTVNHRVNSGKDEWQFFPLMRQAASLQDMVFSWAHNLKGLENAVKASYFLPCIDGDGKESEKHAIAAEDTVLGPGNPGSMLGFPESKDCIDEGSQPLMWNSTNRSSKELHTIISRTHSFEDLSQILDIQHLDRMSTETNQAGKASRLAERSANLEVISKNQNPADFKDPACTLSGEKPDSQNRSIMPKVANRALEEVSQCESSSFSVGEWGAVIGKDYNYSLPCLEYLKLSIQHVLVSYWEEENYIASLEAINDIIGDVTTIAFSRLRKTIYEESCDFVGNGSLLKVALGEKRQMCQCMEKFQQIMAKTKDSVDRCPLYYTGHRTKSKSTRLHVVLQPKRSAHDSDPHDNGTDREKARCLERSGKNDFHPSLASAKVRDLDTDLPANICLSPIIDVISSMRTIRGRLRAS